MGSLGTNINSDKLIPAIFLDFLTPPSLTYYKKYIMGERSHPKSVQWKSNKQRPIR